MLLDTREREREAIANRAAQPAPRPGPAARGAPRFPVFGRADAAPQQLFGIGGMFRPAEHEPLLRELFLPEPPRPEPPRPEPPRPEPPRPEPPRFEPLRPAAQNLGFNDGGDFDWIDNPSACAQFATASAILIRPQSTRCCRPHSSIHSRDDHEPHLRILQQPTEQHE